MPAFLYACKFFAISLECALACECCWIKHTRARNRKRLHLMSAMTAKHHTANAPYGNTCDIQAEHGRHLRGSLNEHGRHLRGSLLSTGDIYEGACLRRRATQTSSHQCKHHRWHTASCLCRVASLVHTHARAHTHTHTRPTHIHTQTHTHTHTHTCTFTYTRTHTQHTRAVTQAGTHTHTERESARARARTARAYEHAARAHADAQCRHT